MDFDLKLSVLNWPMLACFAGLVVVRAVAPRAWYLPVCAAGTAALIGLSSWITLAMIAATALVILWPASRMIRSAKARGDKPGAKMWMWVGIAAVLGLWVFVKIHKDVHWPFLGTPMTKPDGTAGVSFTAGLSGQILELVGFSYFMFKAINYLYIHYLTDLPEKNPLKLLYYALFIPTIMCGPIQKYIEFSREVDAAKPLDLNNLAMGIYRITKGMFFKICLAAWLQGFADDLLDKYVIDGDKNLGVPPTIWISLAAIVSLYLFFFFDFAGYSHIAIGLGQLLGIKVPENFRMPFLATSITEFWRNWHITIGDWFRDHVFVPLGGMRLGGLRASVLAGSIMMVCGIWHGITWPWFWWGVWQGSMIFIDGVTGLKPMPPGERHGPRYWGRLVWTNARCMMAGIFFLKTTDEIGRLLGGFLRLW